MIAVTVSDSGTQLVPQRRRSSRHQTRQSAGHVPDEGMTIVLGIGNDDSIAFAFRFG
jgi:hypothetical protein